MTAAEAILADCQRCLQRGRSAWGGDRLDHGTYRSLLVPDHDLVYQHGRVTWAALVMAQPGLYMLGEFDSTAHIVYSFNKFFDGDPAALERIAANVGALKKAMPKDAQLITFAAEVRNEQPRQIDRLVPLALTNNRQVRYETLYVQRHRLPTRYLAGQFFPVIASESQPTMPMLLPLEHWSPDLVGLWKQAARQKPPATQSAGASTQKDYYQEYYDGFDNYASDNSAKPGIAGAAASRQAAARQGAAQQNGGGLDDAAEAFARNPLQLTPAAAASLRLSARQQGLGEVRIRVAIDRGGYQIAFTDEDPDPSADFVYDSNGLTLVVDVRSARQLTGVQVDLTRSPQGVGFAFRRVA